MWISCIICEKEPKLFKKNYNINIGAKQLAKDFLTLRALLNNPRYQNSNGLVGPDTNHLPTHDLLPDGILAGTKVAELWARNGTAYLEK